MGYGEEVNTSDFDSDIRGFESHYPSLLVYLCSCIRQFESDKPSSLVIRKEIDYAFYSKDNRKIIS